MKKLRLFFTLPSDGNKIIEDGIFLAKLLNLEIQLDALVDAPSQWFALSRSSRDAQPQIKEEMLGVRTLMDKALKQIRQEGIHAEKNFLFKDQLDNLYWESHQREAELILIDTEIVKVIKSFTCIEPLFKYNLSFAYFPQKYYPKNLEDIVISASYLSHAILPQWLKIINLNSKAKLHLLSQITTAQLDHSAESIEKVKNYINTHALSRTKISTFSGETSFSAVSDYATQIEGSLIIFQENFTFNREIFLEIGQPIIRLR